MYIHISSVVTALNFIILINSSTSTNTANLRSRNNDLNNENTMANQDLFFWERELGSSGEYHNNEHNGNYHTKDVTTTTTIAAKGTKINKHKIDTPSDAPTSASKAKGTKGNKTSSASYTDINKETTSVDEDLSEAIDSMLNPAEEVMLEGEGVKVERQPHSTDPDSKYKIEEYFKGHYFRDEAP